MNMRAHTITIRLNDEEHTYLKEQVALSTLKMETYVRQLIMGKRIHAKPCEHHPSFLGELSKISNDTDWVLQSLQSRDWWKMKLWST